VRSVRAAVGTGGALASDSASLLRDNFKGSPNATFNSNGGTRRTVITRIGLPQKN